MDPCILDQLLVQYQESLMKVTTSVQPLLVGSAPSLAAGLSSKLHVSEVLVSFILSGIFFSTCPVQKLPFVCDISYF